MTISKIRARGFVMLFVLAAATGLGAYFFQNRSAAAGYSGAIYTTTFTGTTVNENIYSNKDDVYLNGGPQNLTASGLPDGTYYFQVTDPSGATLLSTDPAVCRQLIVAGGKVAAAEGPACQHPTGIPNSSNGSTPVKLAPFDDTPNNGAEYKVWLIRQLDSTSIAADGMHINFNRNNAKTDNFKVVFTPCTNCNPESVLSGTKFYDANQNGIADAGEPVVEGVQIVIQSTINGETTITTVNTDQQGDWSAAVPTGAVYQIGEYLPGTGPDEPGSFWVQTGPAPDSEGFQGYNGTASGDHAGLNFGNVCFHPGPANPVLSETPCSVSYEIHPTPTPTPPCTDCQTYVLSGTKFYDANQNALFDAGEVPLEGVQIAIAVTIEDVTTISFVTTDESGNWSLVIPAGAEYKIGEFLPDSCPADGFGAFWMQIAPLADAEGFQGYGGLVVGDVGGLNFGNICFKPGEGEEPPVASPTPCGVCYPGSSPQNAVVLNRLQGPQ